MLDKEASLGDPKGKFEYMSRGEKQRRELEARRHRFSGASRFINDGNKPSKEYKPIVL
jgi:hypothetical protein